MKLSDFDFDLPERLIAQTPLTERDQSRLMVVDRATGAIHHESFKSLPQYLADHPLMILNDTKVIPARLLGKKRKTGKDIELLLTREQSPMVHEALVKGLNRLNPGEEIVFGNSEIVATFIERRGDKGLFSFRPGDTIAHFIKKQGKTPLPHYIKRESPDDAHLEKLDRERYQTVYSQSPGAIAAPTAGLHFTTEMLEEIRSAQADIATLTLHVGPGTFQPIRTEDISLHKMEKEQFHIPVETWNLICRDQEMGQKVLAVGTTSTRTLESMKFDTLKNEDVTGWTDRFIYPGQKFNTVDQLLTNFHLPRSTLYMLVCAFATQDLMDTVYKEAVQAKYRFFSYGDAMLIL